MSSIKDFIIEEIKKRRQDYLSSPAYILEHYNLEKQNIEAYNGRQLLEMLQNADDASETARDKKVLVRLTEQELIIANNGTPFSVEGFSSIMYSNLSPKVMLQNQIGQKGLGFRSVLSWAEEIIISSGDVQVAFSENIAKDFLKTLLNKSNEVRDYLIKNSKAEYPIAILRIPKILKEEYSLSGFVTTIRIRLKENILEDVREQIIRAVNKETLIFLNNTECIEIDCEGSQVVYTKTCEDKNRVKVEAADLQSGDTDVKIWNVKRRNGEHKGKNFGLAIAWTDQLEDEENVLYSFFRTHVRFPFPALLHGTFELSQDRNNLIRDTEGHNLFLTEQLADFLVETALEIAGRQEKANYLPLKLLNIDCEKIDTVLQEYNFEDFLQQKIKEKPVFPNVNGVYITYENKPVDYDLPIADLLKGEGCQNLLLYNLDKSVLKHFTLYHYSLRNFIDIVGKKVRDLAISDIALLYYHILTYYNSDLKADSFRLKDCAPFLIDNDKQIIPWDSVVFIEPGNDTSFKFPKTVKISFLNFKLLEEIQALYEADNDWFDEENLTLLGIRKYSVQEIVGMLVEYYRELNIIKTEKNKELHKVLFRLYRHELKRGNSDVLSETEKVPLLTKNGKTNTASDCYFGKEYGCDLTEKLYARAHERLVAAPEKLGLAAKKVEEIKDYLYWLGVSDLPKYKLETKSINKDDAYFQFYLHSFSYPLRKWDWTFTNYLHLYNWMKTDRIELKVGVFDDFDKILEGINLETLLNWIHCDPNLKDTLKKNEEILRGAGLSFLNNRSWKSLEGRALLSYVRWELSRFPLIPVVSMDGNKATPDRCCMSKTITRALSPFIEKPAVNIKRLVARLALREEEIEEYLRMIGIHQDVGTFSVPVLYDILMQLPTSDRSGEIASHIYREIIHHFDEKRIDSTFKEYNEFIQNGRILCKMGGRFNYYRIREAFYLPTKKYGKNLLKYFPLAVFDSKQGARRIEKLFGVKVLKGIRFILMGNSKSSPLNKDFQQEMTKFKSLVYVLRKDMDARRTIVANLKNAEINLVEKMQPAFVKDGETIAYDPENFEYVSTSSRQFYILVPSGVGSLHQLRNNDIFCQSLSEIFEILLETETYTDFIHDLYGKIGLARETRILNYLEKEGREDIEEAMKLMNVTDDIRLTFWRAFCNAGPRRLKLGPVTAQELPFFLGGKIKLEPEAVLQLVSQDFYNNLFEGEYSETGYALLHELFVRFKIDFDKFCLHFSDLDFSLYFKYQYGQLNKKYRDSFACKLFQKLNLSDKKKTAYFDLLEDYDQLKYRDTDGFIPNMKDYFFNSVYDEFSIRLDEQPVLFSIQKSLEQNRINLKTKGIEIPDTLVEDKHIQALLLFNEVLQIQKAIRQYWQKTGINDEKETEIIASLEETVFSTDKYRNLTDRILQQTTVSDSPIQFCNICSLDTEVEKINERKRNRTKQRKVHFNQSDKEETGFIAELLCYHKLVEKWGEEQVRWVSENAYRAYPDKFLTGEAGLGYDMEVMIDSRVHYIEVKGCSNLFEGIHISSKEMQVALEYPEIYDLIIVENPHENPVFKYIEKPFKFNKLQGETLFSNSKFTLLTDSYRLKFKWENEEERCD